MMQAQPTTEDKADVPVPETIDEEPEPEAETATA
jgi:hypothetical protein